MWTNPKAQVGKPGERPRPLALIADDEPLIGATLVEILAEEGIDAIFVSNGESALFWAREAQPDFLILDMVMPKINGLEVAKRVNLEFSGIKIILFSGHATSEDLAERARLAGVTCEVLAKPIRPEALLAKILSREIS
jgi:CheY-like chemotaxis protein